MTPDDPNKEYLPLFKRPPEYTDSALASRDQGYVLVEYTVDNMGFVVNPSIVGASTGKGLQDAAMKAALKFRYAPRFEHGKSVATHGVRNKFTFTME